MWAAPRVAMDPAAEVLAHRKEHYLDRMDPASPEALLVLALAVVAILLGVWFANRWTAHKRSRDRRPRSS